MISSIISRLVILVFGTLYPAYASYKAVRTKNLKEYVKWMMYWIVFALFTCTETFTDVFLSWFPFYYEVKIVLVLWLLSPATKGSSILYRKFVHPALCRREQEIDEYIAKAKDQGYHTVLNLGTKGVNYATTVIMQTAIKGGGGLVQQLRKSYSLSDLSECEPREERGADEADDVLAEPRLIRRAIKSAYATRRSASESNNRSPIYFPEVDVDVRNTRSRMDEPDFSHIKSTEDISSGYSSAENSASLTRTASVGASRSRARTTRTTVTTIKRPQAAEDEHVIVEEPHDDDSYDYTNMPPLVNFTSPLLLSDTDPPFIYQYVGDQIKIIKFLSNHPLSAEFNSKNNNSDKRDQKETSEENQSSSLKESKKSCNNSSTTEKTLNDKDIKTHIPDEIQSTETSNQRDTDFVENSTYEIEDINDHLQKQSIDNNVPEEYIYTNTLENFQSKAEVINDIISDNLKSKPSDNNVIEEFIDSSLNTTYDMSGANDYDSAESNDEFSFETPISTPKSCRKVIKGKYGKDKAPPPPNIIGTVIQETNNDEMHSFDTSHNLVDNNENQVHSVNKNEIQEAVIERENHIIEGNLFKVVNDTPNKILEQDILLPLSVNEIAKKSPERYTKGTTTFGKFLQLPIKLAFWSKTDDKSTSDNNLLDTSRRSSLENITQPFQSCSYLNPPTPNSEGTNQVTEVFDAKDGINSDVHTGRNLPNDISLKSEALQKVIDAKLEEMHPEFKFVSLHDEIPTTSKSTDV